MCPEQVLHLANVAEGKAFGCPGCFDKLPILFLGVPDYTMVSLGIIFLFLFLYKTQENIKNIIFILVLRGV